MGKFRKKVMKSLSSPKSAQVTLFVIFGVLLVVTSIFLFYNYGPPVKLPGMKASYSPIERIDKCIVDAIIGYEEGLFKQSVFPESELNYNYAGRAVPFLCYSSDYYTPCVPQRPLFIESVRANMENYASRELSRCVLSVKEEYESRGFNFESSTMNFSLTFNELDISYFAKLNIVISKEDDVIRLTAREGSLPSVLPKMLRTSESIVNYETTFCEFNLMTWQAVNRDIVIERFRGGDQTKVYTLKDRDSDKEIKFAIKTCVMPAGL